MSAVGEPAIGDSPRAPAPDGRGMGTCRICECAAEHDRYDVREMMLGTREVFTYFRCERCGTLQIHEIPRDLGRYYPRDYYSYSWSHPSRMEGGPRQWLRNARDRGALTGRGWFGRWALRRWPNPALVATGRVPGIAKSWRILDAGCGTGLLVHQLRRLGFANVQGLEPFVEQEIVWPSGAVVRRVPLEEQDGAWDLVMMHHAFEHVPDPRATLRELARLVRPGGALLLRLPVIPSAAWAAYGRDWVGLDAPRHLHLFTVDGLVQLASQAGFIRARTEYDSTEQQFWASEQYRADLPLFDERSWVVSPPRSMFTAAQVATWRRRAAALNREGRGDQAVLHFRRER